MAVWKRNLFVVWFGCFATTAGMSLVVPFLPLYIGELGVHNTAAVEQWSGVAFGATFLLAAIVAPVWGRMADTYGRKVMLLRASLGMAVIMTLMGFVQNVWELVGLRLLMGGVSGYISAAITLVATQAPKEKSGWAMGTLNTGTVGGSLLGPLFGGLLADALGLRHVFFVTGAFMFMAFVVTVLFVKESFVRPSAEELKNRPKLTRREVFARLSNPRTVWAMFVTTFMLQLAIMSINPIVTVYVQQLSPHSRHIALMAGAVVAAAGLANVLAAPTIGKLADKVGQQRVLVTCLAASAVVFVPQAFVQNAWELLVLRFVLGLFMAGLLPSVNSLVRRLVPDDIAGRMFGYNQSAQYLGNLCGPLLGGQLAAAFGISDVFFVTAALLFINAAWVWFNLGKQPLPQVPRLRHSHK
ncbi:multidrug efflux MFS transporter [Alicyclobacillus shizuokensis]|uniref:multidrug efflux MFS transporter n=1 Tax=Alicyclobacillus shizuokensis TaxID=392014 RepID=UPI00082A3B7B|nr:multidrug efflux MFS transporter [Alicyclobacillus shizuokensis]MCL6627327.1 multidrug efflux MFS transporter [Alicyclobacillus shizuokensis]